MAHMFIFLKIFFICLVSISIDPENKANPFFVQILGESTATADGCILILFAFQIEKE